MHPSQGLEKLEKKNKYESITFSGDSTICCKIFHSTHPEIKQ